LQLVSDGINQLLVDRIDQLLDSKDRVVVAIDGNSTAGKSTLSAALKEAYSCNVISTDHFFLSPDKRTPERLSQPGGNIDHERFLDQIIVPLRNGEQFSYCPYDCQFDRLAEPVVIDPNPLVIVEGVYSMHPVFSYDLADHPETGIYDLTVFLQIDADEQKRRLTQRNPHLFERFVNEWIPLENSYFEHFRIAEKCDFVFKGSGQC